MDQAEAEAAVRENYDRMADAYWNHVSKEATVPSLALAGLEYFAQLVKKSGTGPVVDAGCGPGHITEFLIDLDLDAFGVDISPGLLEIARDAHPGVRFEAGELAALPVDAGSLRAVVSKHSLIHTPADLVPAVLDEFSRVLMPGGLLFLSFFGAEAPATHGKDFDHAVSTAYRFDVDAMADMLGEAGLVEKVRTVSQPRAGERQLPYVQFYASNGQAVEDVIPT